ncbi:MAG: ATP-dependent sacrificial sulfur transferase LarE [Candidatus Ratteibacteria bacterium]
MLNERISQLQKILKKMGRVAIAFSGGTDSTFLLKIAVDTLGTENVLVLTAVNPLYVKEESERARSIAKSFGVVWIPLEENPLHHPNFIANSADRCFFCKEMLFSAMKKEAEARGFFLLVDGSNADDLDDFRPGARAKEAADVSSPLQEVSFTKEEIRSCSRRYAIPTWDLPSSSCLASRIPYGEEISLEKLQRIASAEAFLRKCGVQQVRVRDYGFWCRIEVDPKIFGKLLEKRIEIIEYGRMLGYDYVTLDLEGFSSGSMNRRKE